MVLDGVSLSNHVGQQGLRVSSTGRIDGLDVDDSHFDGNQFGWDIANGVAGRIVNVTVDNSTFDGNTFEAAFIGDLQDAVFTDIEATNLGRHGFVFFASTGSPGTIDNITFDGFLIEGQGGATSLGIWHKTYGAAGQTTDFVLNDGTIDNFDIAFTSDLANAELQVTNVNLTNIGTFENVWEDLDGLDAFTGDVFGVGDRDMLTGFDGADQLAGGAGSDLFVIDDLLDGVDTVLDFDNDGADHDQLGLTGIASASAGGTTDAVGGSSTGSVNIQPSDTAGTQTVSIDDDGPGGNAPTDVAILNIVLPSGTTEVSDTGDPDVLINA